MTKPRAAAFAIALGLMGGALFTREAAASDVRDIAGRVEAEWKKAGGVVTRGETRFLYDDETMTVVVPPASDQGCTTVALIGARGISFHAKVAGTDDDPLLEDPSARAASVAGVLQMEACGPKVMDHLVVTSDAGRGAIETVVARSPKPLPALRTILPERTGGVLPPTPDTGPTPTLPPPAKRADQAETRVRRDGARVEARQTWNAGSDGGGESAVTLEPGCHRVELFAPEPPRNGHGTRRTRLDVDAELRDEDDELLARDRTDAADPRLEACVGESIAATVVFAGAPAGAHVAVSHAFWPLPEHLPSGWGAEARARMARAIRVRHLADPRDDAVALFQGPAGATPVPVNVEPGGCYLAIAAVIHGHARGLGVRAVVGARDFADERSADDDAGVVAFCARERSIARLEVDARGVSLAWGLALFRTHSGAWEGSR
jgi:hypothetical protein